MLPVAALICAILAVISRKLSIPSIPLYIVAGLILGKSGLGIFEFDEVARFLTRIGIIFLLFYIGLHLNFEKLSKNVFANGFVDLLVNFSLAFLVATALGFSAFESFVIASAVYISSSAIVLQSLVEFRKLIFPEAETVVWLMIFEDIILVLILIVGSANLVELPVFLLKILVFTFLIYASHKLSKNIRGLFVRDDEIPFLLSFSIATFSVTISEVLGIPEGFVAIMLGAMLSNIKEVERFVTPFKDVFIVLFFFFFGTTVSIGALSIVMVLFVVVAVFGKILSGVAIGVLSHRSVKSGLEIGFDTVARGEFSIFIAFIFGSAPVINLITLVVLASSIIGSLVSKYSFEIISKLDDMYSSVKLLSLRR